MTCASYSVIDSFTPLASKAIELVHTAANHADLTTHWHERV